MKSLKIFTVACLAMLLASQYANAQQPQGRFGVAWIHNNLSGQVTVYYKWVWPNGQVASDWQKTVIQPGRNNYFSWRYDGPNASSPNLYIRFDSDRNQGAVYWEYKLGRGQSPDNKDARYGAHYNIHYILPRKEFAELINGQNGNSQLTDRFSRAPF